ncbi:hypothetical protein GCM10022223_32480 [Kineosporia mesophila]|uniref:Uncharacterized protein n=1 Tax=Kineosporia mesophila TaxID=566012 RepID=A0ABP6ZMU4_9ACTN|nr:hypothetical protein [Kineosporia mesophila]MCD5354426.1 hypothetical protein [Kineosporia mesophila]
MRRKSVRLEMPGVREKLIESLLYLKNGEWEEGAHGRSDEGFAAMLEIFDFYAILESPSIQLGQICYDEHEVDSLSRFVSCLNKSLHQNTMEGWRDLREAATKTLAIFDRPITSTR